MMTQQEIDKLSEALRGQGLTWNQTNFAVSLVRNARTAERERIAAEFTKRADALNTTGIGHAPYIQAQYEAIAGELLDWASSLKA
jgi:hypothetical protein